MIAHVYDPIFMLKTSCFHPVTYWGRHDCFCVRKHPSSILLFYKCYLLHHNHILIFFKAYCLIIVVSVPVSIEVSDPDVRVIEAGEAQEKTIPLMIVTQFFAETSIGAIQEKHIIGGRSDKLQEKLQGNKK